MEAGRLKLRVTGLLLAAAAALAATTTAERLAGQVQQLIAGQRGIRIYDWVGFTVRGDEVTLEGSVTAGALSESIERSVLALEGVASVKNDLYVLPHSGDDIGIRVNAYWRIYGHPEIRRYRTRASGHRAKLRRSAADVQRVLLQPVHIVVRDGHLVLEGELERRRERRVVEQQAYAVLGVRSVTNNIVVTGADTEELEPINFEADPWWLDSESVAEPVLRVENPTGAVRVVVTNTERVRVRRASRDRAARASDTVTNRFHRKTRVRVQPEDGALIDLEVDVPYGHRVEVETVDGDITLAGLVRRAELRTEIGSVLVSAPWRCVRLEVESRKRPSKVDIPLALRARWGFRLASERQPGWLLSDGRDGRTGIYGSVRVTAGHPAALVVRELDIPEASPVRMHWQAPDALRTMLRAPFRMSLASREATRSVPSPAQGGSGEVAQFTSEVRLVQLSAAVVDGMNRPIQGLTKEHFAILEDGAEQEINMLRDTDAVFNLILLLDCSTSTLVDREAVMEAARRFVLAARPADRVGIYVLSDAYVHVVSPLTPDRDALLRTIERIPRLSGGTPLYDAITLSYAHELARRRWERNAMIVISDGMDNDLLPHWRRSVPSEVPFEDLLRAAAEINSAIYPIFLEPEAPSIRTDRSWRERLRRATDEARGRMSRLAEATGGRIFLAQSVGDLDSVYEEVAEELRSVYTLAYYPSNQEFNGEWRRIRVAAHRDGARVRTRPGYYGW